MDPSDVVFLSLVSWQKCQSVCRAALVVKCFCKFIAASKCLIVVHIRDICKSDDVLSKLDVKVLC